MDIGFIGTGNLAGAMIKSVTKSKPAGVGKLFAYDIDEAKLAFCSEQFGVVPAGSAQDIARMCAAVIIAVKPADIPALLGELDGVLKESKPLVISTAAGTSLKHIMSFLSEQPALARIMPNINAAADASVTAYCTNGVPSAEQVEFIRTFCSSFGAAIALDEQYFPAFGVLGGAAPAFAYLFIDQLARAGVKIGMNKTLSLQIAAQTVLGSAKMILESGEHPGVLIDRVCSPGGITIEGVAALQELGFENAVLKAVERAFEKDSKLGAPKQAV